MTVPRTTGNMAFVLYDSRTHQSRELALPPGLTFEEAKAWAEKYVGTYERIGDTVEYR